ncbi:MAG: hypothetical protein H6720_23695 [Sandaracinus sp.]|nr:hypothetical protein [Sandaracinus sp.]
MQGMQGRSACEAKSSASRASCRRSRRSSGLRRRAGLRVSARASCGRRLARRRAHEHGPRRDHRGAQRRAEPLQRPRGLRAEHRAHRAGSAGGGAPMEDWVGAIGEFQRQMNVATEDVPDLIGMVTQAARDGSIEAGDIAANFAGIMSSFATLRGGKGGLTQAREFMGLSEVMGAGGRSSEETRTLVTNLMSILSRSEVQTGIERATGNRNLFDERGVMQASFPELFAAMNEARGDAFRSPRALERMKIKDVQARDAIMAVLAQFERGSGANPIADIAAASSAEGNAVIDQTMADLCRARRPGDGDRRRCAGRDDGERRARRLAMTRLVGADGRARGAVPLLTQAMGTLKDVVTSTGIAMAGMNFLGLGGEPPRRLLPPRQGSGGTTAASVGRRTCAGRCDRRRNARRSGRHGTLAGASERREPRADPSDPRDARLAGCARTRAKRLRLHAPGRPW